MLLSNEAFLKEYSYHILHILQSTDLITTRNLQRGRFLPKGDCNGKKVTSAAIGHHFLQRLETLGFGMRRTVNKRNAFQRHYWDELSPLCKERLKFFGISQGKWVELVFTQNTLLLASDTQPSKHNSLKTQVSALETLNWNSQSDPKSAVCPERLAETPSPIFKS